jgi:hypothetical protein
MLMRHNFFNFARPKNKIGFSPFDEYNLLKKNTKIKVLGEPARRAVDHIAAFNSRVIRA